MSTIKVNTLDTTSGTEITVASGKTLSVGGKSVTARVFPVGTVIEVPVVESSVFTLIVLILFYLL